MDLQLKSIYRFKSYLPLDSSPDFSTLNTFACISLCLDDIA